MTDLTSAIGIEAAQLGTRNVTETIDNVCEIIQPNLTKMFKMSILNVCSLPSKLGILDCIELLQSHAINWFVETKINDIDGSFHGNTTISFTNKKCNRPQLLLHFIC